jgi:two-component system sensor histidine kinase BaeS
MPGHMMCTQMMRMMWQMMGPPEYQYIAAVNRSIWLSAAVVILAAAIMSIFFARRISQPIRRLTVAAGQVASGDLEQKVEIETRDEIGKLAETFNSMVESLKRNKQLRERLLAGIAHEIKTPLTIIQGNLEAVLDGLVEATPEQIAKIHTETLLLSRVVSDLRDLALAETGHLQLQIKKVSIEEIIEQVLDMVGPLVRDKKVDIQLEIAENLPLLKVDSTRISQVFYNLLANALEYTPPQGLIKIEAKLATDTLQELLVVVRDNGLGIDKEDLPYIFDLFYRGKSAKKTKVGSGIGLAMVKYLVESHGGQIWVESAPNKGSSFFFTLPVT